MTAAIIIPARYASTRFPGKPLALIGGIPMLAHVIHRAREAIATIPPHTPVRLAVASDDHRILDVAKDFGVDGIMTPTTCATGSDRVNAALTLLGWDDVDCVLGLQGDAPFTPVAAIRGVLEMLTTHTHADVVTPVVRLRWSELDALRHAKRDTPFSGTTAIIDPSGRALWFSKTILPAIRSEDRSDPLSPVYQHIGLYGFRRHVLARFVTLPESVYEKLEGLEQLRMLENEMVVQTLCVAVDPGAIQAGVDTPADLERANALWTHNQGG